MKQRQPVRLISRGAIGKLAALILAVGAGAVLTSCNSNPPTSNVTPTQIGNSVKESIQPKKQSVQPTKEADQAKAEIYLLQAKGNKIELVARQVTIDKTAAANKNSEAILAQAFNSLLAESNTAKTNSKFSSSIPKGTKLRSVKVDKDTVTVNLSPEFTTGGGSASMIGRLGQVIYTATSLNPNAKVIIAVDGKRLQTLGGEGLDLSEPLTRQSFQKDFPL